MNQIFQFHVLPYFHDEGTSIVTSPVKVERKVRRYSRDHNLFLMLYIILILRHRLPSEEASN
jgi:hypothetical protein